MCGEKVHNQNMEQAPPSLQNKKYGTGTPPSSQKTKPHHKKFMPLEYAQ